MPKRYTIFDEPVDESEDDDYVGSYFRSRYFWNNKTKGYDAIPSLILYTGLKFTAEWGHGCFTYSNAPYNFAYIHCVGAYGFTSKTLWVDVAQET